MSEQTKGKLEVRAYMSPPNKYRIADKNGETILSDASPEVFKGKKGKELLSRICQCVNAFEPGGSHSKLLEALKSANGMLNHVGCPSQGCRGGAIQISEDDFEQCQWCYEKSIIEQAIAEVK